MTKDRMTAGQLLYVRYYERLDNERELITKKYYDLDAIIDCDAVDKDLPCEYNEKIGQIWPVDELLIDLERAAVKK